MIGCPSVGTFGEPGLGTTTLNENRGGDSDAPSTDGAGHDPGDSSVAGGDNSTSGDPILPGDDNPPPGDEDIGPVVDCATVPDSPISSQILDGARGYHDMLINDQGEMIGADIAGTLIKATYTGQTDVFLPSTGTGEQMEWLDSGEFAFVSETGSLQRITTAGSITNIASDIFPYAVVLGLDGQLYTTTDYTARDNQLSKVDPMSGSKQILMEWNPQGDTAHGIGFSIDGRRLYIGTIGDGTVYYLDFDQDMNIVGGLEVFAENVSQSGPMGGWHDAVGVDACGNVYIPDYRSSNLYRISPEGEVLTYFRPNSADDYPHAVLWGSGQHGWRDDALYVPLPYNNNQVMEIVIGVPSREFSGTVLNRSPQAR